MLHIEHAEYHHAQMRCYLCPNVDDLVDTQVSIEGEGILAICRHCVGEMIQALDITPQADDLEVMTDLYQQAVASHDTLVRRERSLRGQLRTFKERQAVQAKETAKLVETVRELETRIEDERRAYLRVR